MKSKEWWAPNNISPFGNSSQWNGSSFEDLETKQQNLIMF
jgi:hypothetical protein